MSGCAESDKVSSSEGLKIEEGRNIRNPSYSDSNSSIIHGEKKLVCLGRCALLLPDRDTCSNTCASIFLRLQVLLISEYLLPRNGRDTSQVLLCVMLHRNVTVALGHV